MATKGNFGERKTRSPLALIIVIGLCCFFYILGAWQRSGFGKGDTIALEVSKNAEFILNNLNYETHSGGDDDGKFDDSESTVQEIKPCEDRFIDYTPCHDQMRAMTFPRENMNYRQRHCPLQEAKLRCLEFYLHLQKLIAQEVGRSVIDEYIRLRGHLKLCCSTPNVSTSKFHAYVKPRSDEGSSTGTKKPSKTPKDVAGPSYQAEYKKNATSSHQENRVQSESRNQSNQKKKKAGKVISLAEAAKGSIIFQQGKPCSCQARQHGLISNCLSCGKIVCEQEGEGPCLFCGALVLKEGSTYAGLEEGSVPLSDVEAAAEAYAKRLVDYDRNAAARTTVIDDQSDYYEIEGNSWLSKEEKELLQKKREEDEEAERAKRNRVVVTFDLVGRKVLLNQDEASELESENRILLRPQDEREVNRIKPNPSLQVQPIFIDPGVTKKQPVKGKKQTNRYLPNGGLCLEITGRVQHDNNELKHLMIENQAETA